MILRSAGRREVWNGGITMPPKPHFITGPELTRARANHLIMSEEDRAWLQGHLNRINETMQYHINGRTSMDDALRLYLIADKGFTLDQAFDMNGVSAAQMKKYYEEFIKTYADPEKSSEENMYLLGGMHSRALMKIQEFRLPDYSNTKTVEAFIPVHTFFEKLSGLMTSLDQDTQIQDPKLRLAYYAGAGGRSNLKKLVYPIEVAHCQVNTMLDYLDHPKTDYPADTKAQYLKLCRNKFANYSQKTLGEMRVPTYFATEALVMLASNDVMKGEKKGHRFSQEGMGEYNSYLAGGQNDIPLQPEIEQALARNIIFSKQTFSGYATNELRNNLVKKGYESYLSCPHPEDIDDDRDIFRLSEDDQKTLQTTYIQMFDRGFNGLNMNVIYEMGLDEFDMIKVRGGETISQMVSRKYPELDQETRFRALMMETVRHALTDGVVIMDLDLNPETGTYSLKNSIAIEAKTAAELRAEETSAMEEGLSVTKAERETIFRKEDGEIIESVDALSPEQKENAAEMYDRVFGPMFDSINMRDYRVQNPEKQDADFFRVGGMSLRSFLGERKMNELLNAGLNTLRAEILRMATDPKIPLSITTVKYDALKDEFSDEPPIHIMDAEDKLRIRTEYPHLNKLSEYKHWIIEKYQESMGPAAQTLIQSFDEKTWIDMYHSEFHHAAVTGFSIPKERVVSPAQLAAQAEDPVNPHSLTFENVKTVFGPKPRVVEGWVGSAPGDNIYTKENFLQHAPELPQGSFSEGDFSLVSYYAAFSPDIVVSTPYKEVPAEWMSKEDQFRNSASMWTMDVAAFHLMPRSNFGDAFLEKAIKPARTAASDMIRAYESGDQERMVGILANGLKEMMKYTMTIADLANTKGPATFQLHMLRKTDEMLERYPGIRGAVMDRLTEEEKDKFQVLLRLEDVVNQSVHAEARLDEAKSAGEELSPEETQALTKKVDALSFYAGSWENNFKSFFDTPEYKAFDEASSRALTQRSYQLPGDPGPGIVRSNEVLIYEMDHMKVAPDIREALLSEDPFAAAEKIRGSKAALDRYYTDEWQKMQQARETLARAAGEELNEADQNEADQNREEQPEVTPEACDAAVRTQEESGKRLEALTLLLESQIAPPRLWDFRNAYNLRAEQRGWPQIQDIKASREELSPVRHPERFQYYFDMLIGEYRSDVTKCYRIEDKLGEIKVQTDPDFEVALDQPLKKRFARWEKYFRKHERLNSDLVQADRSKMREVADHLTEADEKAVASITRANDPSKGNAVRMENLLRGSAGYNEDEKEFSGILEKRKVGTGVPEVKVITEETKAAYRRLLDNPPEISDALRTKGLSVIQMMQERSMLEESLDGKNMAHGRTVRGRTRLASAVERSPMQGIREADDLYLAAYEAEKEVFDHIKNSFAADTWVPKNMTLTGEKKVPPAFILDPVTDSRMNALWQVGMTAKRLGVSAEEFIQNPGRHLMQDLQTKLAENGLSSMTEPGDDFITSVEKLYSRGRELSQGGGLKGKVLGGLSGEEYVEKAIGNLLLMEEDPERRKGLAAYTKKLGQAVDAAVERENAACICLYQMVGSGSRVDRKSGLALWEGLKSAFLSGGAIGKEHLPISYTNNEGLEEARPVKYQELLARKNAYAELTAIYKKTLPGAKASGRRDMKLIVQETMLDYLMAHPEDRDKKEYKSLEKLALNADTEMQVPQPRNEAERGRRPKTRYNQWKQDLAAELRNLENAAVGRDREVNQEVLRLQQEAEAAARGRHPNRTLAWEKMEQIETRVQERQAQLLTAWQRKEITDSYFRARFDDLNEVLKNPGRKLKNPPKFTDQRKAEQYAEDMKLISNRVCYTFGEGYLKSFDSFKEWKKKQWDSDPDVLAGYSTAEWKNRYREELYNASKRRGTPNWIKEKRAEAQASIQVRRQRRQQELAPQNNAAQNNQAQNNNAVQNNGAQNNAGAGPAPGHRRGPGPA